MYFLLLCFFLAITTAFFIERDSVFFIFFIFFFVFSHGYKYFLGVAIKGIGRTKRKIKKNTKAITIFCFFSFTLELKLLLLWKATKFIKQMKETFQENCILKLLSLWKATKLPLFVIFVILFLMLSFMSVFYFISHSCFFSFFLI